MPLAALAVAVELLLLADIPLKAGMVSVTRGDSVPQRGHGCGS